VSARKFVLRFLGGTLGAGAATIAVGLPLFFVAFEANELSSYDGPISVPAAVGVSALILGIAGVSGFLAFMMLRFAFTGREKLWVSRRKPDAP
jgi:uncharacterized membrane protein YfcA